MGDLEESKRQIKKNQKWYAIPLCSEAIFSSGTSYIYILSRPRRRFPPPTHRPTDQHAHQTPPHSSLCPRPWCAGAGKWKMIAPAPVKVQVQARPPKARQRDLRYCGLALLIRLPTAEYHRTRWPLPPAFGRFC